MAEPDVRQRNAAALLRSLRTDGPATRAELAGRTGLAKATVGAIVGDLELAGAVRAHEQVRSGDRGRPGLRLTLAGGRPVGIGFEANVEYVAAVVVDLSGAVRHRVTQAVADVHWIERALAAVAEEIAALLREDGQHPVGATVAVPGLIAEDDRTIAWTPNLGVTGTALAAVVDDAFGWKGRARVSNDADCAALAELHHGAGRGTDHLLYLTGTVGIGAGLVDGGRLVGGARGFAGEVGHLPIGEPDARCGCGRLGAGRRPIGLHAVLAKVGLAELETPEATARAVADVARRDPAVREALVEVGVELGRGPGHPHRHPRPRGDRARWLLRAARRRDAGAGPGRARTALAAPVQELPDLRPGELGTESAALGAAERALAEVYDGSVEVG